MCAGGQADLRYIGRDALAVLLGVADDGAPRCDAACVLDVRRGDERALYGSITGASRGSAGDARGAPRPETGGTALPLGREEPLAQARTDHIDIWQGALRILKLTPAAAAAVGDKPSKLVELSGTLTRLACAAAGAVHVPADQLPAALHLAPAEWEAVYRCAKPGPDTWLVLQSRTCQRAAWAAQVRARTWGCARDAASLGRSRAASWWCSEPMGLSGAAAHVDCCGAYATLLSCLQLTHRASRRSGGLVAQAPSAGA